MRHAAGRRTTVYGHEIVTFCIRERLSNPHLPGFGFLFHALSSRATWEKL